MLISLDHGFVFLCNRKCASISIEQMLRAYADVAAGGPPGLRHTNYRTYRRHVAPWLRETAGGADLVTTCVVREPVSWLYSWYRFRSRLALRNPAHPDHVRSTAGVSFEEFLSAYMQPHPPAFAQVGCQFDFVRTEEGEIGVDRIFRYEALDELVAFMSERVGSRLRLRRRNVSPRKNRELYLASVLDRVTKAATSALGAGPVVATSPPPLPGRLHAALRQFIAADFALYEHARAAARAPGARQCVSAGS